MRISIHAQLSIHALLSIHAYFFNVHVHIVA